MFRKLKVSYFPKFIIYDKCKVKIPLHNSDFLECISVDTPVDEIITYEKYLKILGASPNKRHIEYIENNNLYLHKNLIEGAIGYIKKTYGDTSIKNVTDDILNLTFYDWSCDKWNITNVARKYQFDGFDVFVEFSTRLSEENDDKRKEKLLKDFNDKFMDNQNNKYAYFDYYDEGMYRMKNSFPKNINDNETPFTLNMRRYDECGEPNGYHKIFKLMTKSIINKKVNDNFSPWVLIEKKNKIDMNALEKEIEKNNVRAETLLTESQRENINKFGQNYCNHRNNLYDQKPWEYQTQNIYSSHISKLISTGNSHKLELCHAFDNYNGLITFSPSANIKEISIVNMIIYGKTKILSLENVERLLPYIRFKSSSKETRELFQLDNYVLLYKSFYDNKEKRYEVLWDDENIDELSFASKDIDKLYVAKNMIQLMNEVDPKLLNIHNYRLICDWYSYNDLAIQSFHTTTTNFFKK